MDAATERTREAQPGKTSEPEAPNVAIDPKLQAPAVIEFLEAVARNRGLLAELDKETRDRLLETAGRVAMPDRMSRRVLAEAFKRKEREQARRRKERQEQTLNETGIRRQRRSKVFPTPRIKASPPAPMAQLEFPPAPAVDPEEVAGVELEEPRNCYVCKRDYHQLHTFYDALCPDCARLNWHKRNQSVDLSGRVALLTGGRVKIGYQAAIKILRAGAQLIVTTRFPRDAAARFAAEEDFGDWRERLSIYGLDLRHTPSVEAFCAFLQSRLDRLDFIINNACQTVRRPPAFYEHLMEGERALQASLPPGTRSLLEGFESLRANSAATANTLSGHLAPKEPALRGLSDAPELSQVPLIESDLQADSRLFPEGQLDADLQQVDLRGRNSWRLALGEVATVELLEVHLVNAVAPFVINGRLRPLMAKDPTGDRHIVNVSAVEGQFYRAFKTAAHPHTNMAKAALNMLTRTSAADYLGNGIHMNSVDTGWITDEDPLAIAARKQKEMGFHPPLDLVDAAARILDPIFDGLSTGEHLWGKFLKDYRVVNW